LFSLIFFLISLDSPVKEDSLQDKLPLIKIPSAGIESPVDSFTISPTTTSFIIISFKMLFLITLTLFDPLWGRNGLNLNYSKELINMLNKLHIDLKQIDKVN